MRLERFAFDTSVVISALCFEHSKPAQVFFYALQQGIILASNPVLEEWHSVLRRRKFDAYLPLAEREQFLDRLSLAVTMVDIDQSVSLCRDPKDNKFLELAACGNANYLITGDADLLVLHPFRDVAILTPDQFLSLQQSDTNSE